MTDRPDNLNRHDELLAKLLDGQLTPEETQEFCDMLHRGEVSATDFTEDVSIHAALAWHGIAPRPFSAEELQLIESKQRESESSQSPVSASGTFSGEGPRLRNWLFAVLATAAMFLIIFTVPWTEEIPQEQALLAHRDDPAPLGTVDDGTGQVDNSLLAAEIIDAVGTSITTGLELAGDRRIHVGQTLEIESGLVELKFLCGADAVLAGPARLKVMGSKEVALDIGKITVRMDEGVDGFLVHTPDGRIKDLGTAFGVEVSGDTASHVSVFDGAVDVTSVTRVEAHKVSAGEAVRLNRDGSLDKLEPVHSLKDIRDFSLKRPSHVISANKDAFVRGGTIEGLGEHRNYGDTTELHVKLDTADVNYTRRAWLGFDLSDVPRDEIVGARLVLTVLPNRLAEIAEPTNVAEDTNWLFEVSGLWDVYDSPWLEHSITWGNAPGNATETVSGQLTGPKAPTSLGEFSIRSRGTLGDKVQISGPELLEYIRSDSDGNLTLIVSRRSGLISGINDDRVVHGFASREHPEMDPPTLVLWCEAQSVLDEADESPE